MQEKCPVTYTAPVGEVDAPTVTILEAPFLLSCGGDSGNRTWAAALHLATYLFTDGRHYVENKSVLELGAGLGFLSILCGKHLGAKHVLITDGSEAVMDLAQGNVVLNGVEGVVETSVLKWGTSCIDDVLQDESGLTSYDLILGADIVSDLSIYYLVLRLAVAVRAVYWAEVYYKDFFLSIHLELRREGIKRNALLLLIRSAYTSPLKTSILQTFAFDALNPSNELTDIPALRPSRFSCAYVDPARFVLSLFPSSSSLVICDTYRIHDGELPRCLQ